MRPQGRRILTLEECQPDYENSQCPVHINDTRKRDGVLYVAGEGPKDSPIVFITPALEEEEATSISESVYGMQIGEKPQILKGGIGNLLKEAAGLAGLRLDNYYCTTLIKWLMPRALRNNPKKDAVAWATPALMSELKEIKPKIIVCMGKLSFDQLVPIKLNQADALGGWFWSEPLQARVFLMDKPVVLLTKPEKLETFRILFKEVKAMLDRVEGVTLAPKEPVMHFVRNEEDLRRMVTRWMLEGIKLFCVDCEWGGNNHIDGKLRSIQFGISATEGYCVTFMNSKKEYTMGISYAEVGKILGQWLNRPDVKYIGHYASVDLPWMHRWLNLDWYDKVVFDTAFALQTCDENAGMGLEVLSMAYTTFGRYDLDLVLWKKLNRPDKDDGYATIPDEILEPYSILDVLVPFAAMPYLKQRLQTDNLERYYYELFQPFVTNVFTSFAITGLPMDVPKMDELRRMFHFAEAALMEKFRKTISDESWFLLARAMQERGDLGHIKIVQQMRNLVKTGNAHLMVDLAKQTFGTKWAQYEPWIAHCAAAPTFNPQSQPQMLRWLFKCKGLTPIKSTDQKEKGIRAMSWDKVLELPADKQKEFTPAMDKQSLQILSEQDVILMQLLKLKDIGNICRIFLKEATIDKETGEVDRENGLHFFICSDTCVHPNSSSTETGRHCILGALHIQVAG